MPKLRSLLAIVCVAIVAGATPAPAADELALKRVLLSTGGVGYFEYEAKVEGTAELSLNVRLDQVDDVLKSVVVYDDKGRVGTISLPGKTPLKEVFRELPFNREALGSPIALLSALRGAEVEVKGARALKGRIISVRPETTQIPDGKGVVTRHRVSLMTAQGLRQLILEDTDLLRFTDPKLQGDIDRVLATLAELGERDRRTLKVSVSGDGARTVRVAYVVEAPLWKTSYRLTVPDDPLAASGDLQGWAVVENRSGEDWTDVELTIVSGNPVTFRQALYDTYYVKRPEVPIEVLGRIMPRVDKGTVAPVARPAPEARLGKRGRPGRAASLQSFGAGGMARTVAEAPAAMDAAKLTASESTEATSYVIFRHPDAVTVSNGYSLVVPIVARSLKAERLALYQPDTDATHPLAAIGLINDSATALPPGILTLYERGRDGRVAYVGDARIKTLPAGEKRLLSYALDQKTRVDRETRSQGRVTSAKIAGGTLVLTRRQRQETLYRIKAPAKQARRLVIEHRRIPGWDRVEPAEAKVELTPSHYRIRHEVEAGTTGTLTVALERTELQRVALADLSRDRIRYYASARELGPEQRKAMAELGRKLSAVEDAETKVAQHEQTLEGLYANQERLRKNLASVPKDSDLFQRYLTRMQADEDAIQRAKTALETDRKRVAAARQALLDYARALKL